MTIRSNRGRLKHDSAEEENMLVAMDAKVGTFELPTSEQSAEVWLCSIPETLAIAIVVTARNVLLLFGTVYKCRVFKKTSSCEPREHLTMKRKLWQCRSVAKTRNTVYI